MDNNNMKLEAPRPCERQCEKCRQWLHVSRFRKRLRKRGVPHGSVWHFDPECKACQQIERNEKKNLDRPHWIVEQRAKVHALKLGVSKDYLWVIMNWRSLVPVMRAMMSSEGRCLSCGHRFLNERDIQIEHRSPPRHDRDWARHHARNIALNCQSCNGTKSDKCYDDWLDEQEEARISNEIDRDEVILARPAPAQPVQQKLFV